MMNNSVLIVGLGASGLMAALTAAKNGAKVTIIEKNDIPGKKILATGNGKCNLANLDFRLDCYYSDCEDLNLFFKQFDVQDTIETFEELGLIIKNVNGYLYPVTNQATSVRDVLFNRLNQYDINVMFSKVPQSITKENNGFNVVIDNNKHYFDKVILACGSYAGIRKCDRVDSAIDGYSLAYHLGHSIIPVKPALTQIVCNENFFKDIAGVRIDAIVKLVLDNSYIAEEYGELQITDYGLSGIPIFQMSRIVAADNKRKYSIEIDFMPGVSEEEFAQICESRIIRFQGTTVSDFFTGLINTKLAELIVKLSKLDKNQIIDETLTDQLISALALIKCFNVTVKNTKSFENAQCCSGGVPVSEIDMTCMSQVCPNLFLCGEMLNVDAKCGGYNLQWAWTTGYIAGKSAAGVMK